MLNTFMVLRDMGIIEVKIEYSGGGDSGQIDGIIFITKDGAHHEDEIPSEVKQKIENYSYYLLDDVEDWYNNDGGWGEIYIDIVNNTYKIDNNVRYTESTHYEHNGEVDL